MTTPNPIGSIPFTEDHAQRLAPFAAGLLQHASDYMAKLRAREAAERAAEATTQERKAA